MSGHRIELLARFTVDDGEDKGRDAAESVLRQLEYLAEHGQLDNETTDLTFTPLTVDGADWDEKYPPRPKPVYRCGFQIEPSLNLLPDCPGAYRVSRGGQSNIIGAKFFDEINGDSDHAFTEFMTAALRPDFPHPFAMEG